MLVMARDFDFVRTKATKTKATPSKPSQQARRGRRGLVIWLTVLGLLVLGAAFYWLFKQATVPAKDGRNLINNSALAPTNFVEVADEQLTGPLVQIYNSGAGEAAVAAVVATMKKNKFRVEPLANSQFEYDKTYIWYRRGLETIAQEIARLMPERLTSLKETQISGAFDILIYLGKR